MSITYDTIKRTAKEHGVSVKDLIVLAPQNDPFYVGTPGDHAQARWFADLWHQFGYHTGVHIRRVHYQIISQDPPLTLPDGTPYENTERCWDYLTIASKKARYLELVTPQSFVDKRNPDAHIYTTWADAPPALTVENDADYGPPELPAMPDLPSYHLSAYPVTQRYHLEIWCEKSTMNDVLLPICRDYQTNLQTGLGELSITATLAVVQRIVGSGKPGRIFYISDFDPGGLSMPVAVARKIEYFMQTVNGQTSDIQLIPIVLTADQCKAYQLPRTPIKESERRAARFEARFGEGATELDALEALYPGALRRIITQELDRYYDHGLAYRAHVQAQTAQTMAENKWHAITAQHQPEIDELTADYDDLCAEFAARVDDHAARVCRLWRTIATELEAAMIDLDDYPVPEADQAEENGECLFDSTRTYLEQLRRYKAFQGK